MGFKKRFAGVLFAIGLLIHVSLSAQLSAGLPRVIPETEGVSSTAIHRFIDAANKSKNEFHSFIFLRHGKVVAEGWWNPYKPSLKHTLYSTSKSFTSTAVGFAVTEGRIKMNDKVVSFFPKDLPDTISTLMSALTIKDLITMSVGQSPDPTGAIISKNNWVKSFFATPIVDTPGVKFLYNSAATYMLSAIVQKVTGEKILDYLKPRLFVPLGIEGMDWELSPEGINTGGWGLRLKTEDMAKFGQLYLQKGMWKGKEILPKEWIEEATTLKIKTAADTAVTAKARSDWAQGYCYQFWRCRNNAFRADGAFGQYIIVMPDKDAVIAITSETTDMQNILDLVWEHLLPSMTGDVMTTDKQAASGLKKQLSSLSIPTGSSKPADPALVSNISGKTFVMEANPDNKEKISFLFQKNMCSYTVTSGGINYTLNCGRQKWIEGETAMPGGPPSLTGKPRAGSEGFATNKIAAAYSWKNDATLVIQIRYTQSAHSETVICHFNKDELSIRFDNSLKAMTPGANEANPVLKGKQQ